MLDEQLLQLGIKSLYELLDYYLELSFCVSSIEKIKITILESDFYHLLGFHKLTDIPELKRNKVLVVKRALKNQTFRLKICGSIHYDEIPDRLDAIIDLLENFKSGKNLFYLFDKARIFFQTRIEAKYFIRSDFEDIDLTKYRYFYFINEREENSDYVFDSMFKMGKYLNDYSKTLKGYSIISFVAHKISENKDIPLSIEY